MSALEIALSIVASLCAIFGWPITSIYRNSRATRRGVDWLLEIHNYPNKPGAGHFWPQPLRERSDRDRRIS